MTETSRNRPLVAAQHIRTIVARVRKSLFHQTRITLTSQIVNDALRELEGIADALEEGATE